VSEDFASIDHLVGRHFVSTSDNVARIERIGPGALRVVWRTEATEAERNEFEAWFNALMDDPVHITRNIGKETEAEAYARWKAQH
jgi:hypothetical protein